MLRDIIPALYRRAIYLALTTLYSLELIFDVVDSDLQAKLLQAAAVLGFGLAAGNTFSRPGDDDLALS
ncbi:MAG: hypothetical protein EBW71_10195 [Betaproteobacteria bacterium]|nr:hypothetical protein [Betaproteobacteria bacterium]